MNTNFRICEKCGEKFDENDLDLATDDYGDQFWLCRICEEELK